MSTRPSTPPSSDRQTEEASEIFAWLARELSPDTYVNIMGQYRPDHRVGQLARDGGLRHPEIDRCTDSDEMRKAYDAARAAGLWRFDERRPGLQILH